MIVLHFTWVLQVVEYIENQCKAHYQDYSTEETVDLVGHVSIVLTFSPQNMYEFIEKVEVAN